MLKSSLCLAILCLLATCPTLKAEYPNNANNNSASLQTTREPLQISVQTPNFILKSDQQGCTNLMVNQRRGYKLYLNSRFSYSLKYPASWGPGIMSDNGDGIRWCMTKPEIDIRTYATYIIPGLDNSPEINKQVETRPLTLANGNIATSYKQIQNKRALYRVVLKKNDVEYNFYANVTLDFYRKHHKLLEEIAKSLQAQ